MTEKTIPLFKERLWQVVEMPFRSRILHHFETILTIGNGYMGLRGTFEEGYPGEIASTFVHGIYDHGMGELVPELVNLPNPLPMLVEVDGEPFNLNEGHILGYRRALNLKTATLTRAMLWRNSRGTIVQLTFERFASLESEHLLAQRITVRALNAPATITVSASIDGKQTNDGVHHWGSLEAGVEAERMAFVLGTTGQSGYRVAIASCMDSDRESTTDLVRDSRQPTIRMTVSLAKEQAARFVKLSAIHSSRDADDPLTTARQTLEYARQRGWEAVHAAHVEEWEKYWSDSDVEIEGDELAQRAIRFATYHVLIAAPRHDDRVSIGAKALSGPGYKGHVFWDTELFMLPLLSLTQPRLARALLMYRYHNLPGARHKAQKAGYEGAMYPWESTDTGEETTPQWSDPLPDGTRIRIWTGETEQHISTDIAYAVLQYWRWTGDDEFFVNYGAEIVLDTAVFWGSRAEWNPEQDRFELNRQIGPDEYHENINNSAFTNCMVRWHLRTAIEVQDWLHRYYPLEAVALSARLGISEERLAHWQRIVAGMYIPYDKERGIYEQFEGFFNLQPLDLAHWQPRAAIMDSILGHSIAQETMVIKQADVVMLMALLGEEAGSYQDRIRNWEFYFPLVDHGSSLSPSTHAWVAARLGLTETAYRLFMYAASIDLEDAKGNVRDGIHAAAAGGLWEAVVLGFAGLRLEGTTFTVDPKLPEHWRSIRFRIWHRGQQHIIHLTSPEPI